MTLTAPCPACGGIAEAPPCDLCDGAKALPLSEVTQWHWEQARKANERKDGEP